MGKLILKGGVSAPLTNYVDDVFSAYTYVGTGANQTITNGIDLTTGGLVWTKNRGNASHGLIDTVRGTNTVLVSNVTDGSSTAALSLTSFLTTGYTLGTDASGYVNPVGNNLISWTFKKKARFFDIVTYTGNATNRTIAHSLGSTPGMIIVKSSSAIAEWRVYHKDIANTAYGALNTTALPATNATVWNSTTATASV